MTELDKFAPYYAKYWKALFGNVLGWSESDVERWALGWRGIMEPESMFYHESPTYYASTVFLKRINTIDRGVWQIARDKLLRRLLPVEREVNAGIPTDWEVLKVEIDAIINGL